MLAFVVLCSASPNKVQRGANTFADWYRAISRHITPCVFTCLRLVVPWFCLCLPMFALVDFICLLGLPMEPAFYLGMNAKDAVARIFLHTLPESFAAHAPDK